MLARASLLDGLRATTHWMAAAELARRHRQIIVDADVLYVDNGRVLTSAGASAGMDLCSVHRSARSRRVGCGESCQSRRDAAGSASAARRSSSSTKHLSAATPWDRCCIGWNATSP